MRRLFKIAAVAVVLGAVVNVLVAWGCALWVEVPPSQMVQDASGLVRGFIPADWTVPPPGSEKGYTLAQAAEVGVRPGLRVVAGIVWWRPDEPGGQPQHRDGSGRWVTIQSCGWPRLNMESALTYEYPGQITRMIGGVRSPVFPDRPISPAGAAPWASPIQRPGLPLRPLVLPFAINTLFYAAVIGGVFFAPGPVRRWVRRRKGRCTACGYDLRGLASGAACPECGPVVAKV